MLTKAQKKNLLLIDEADYTKLTRQGIKSLLNKNLIEVDDYDFPYLTDRGLVGIKLAKAEKFQEEFEKYSRRELIEKCELAFQHSFPVGQLYDEEIVDALVAHYVQFNQQEFEILATL